MSNISRLTSLAAAGAGGETEQYIAIACSGTVSDLRNSLVVIPFNKNDGFGDYQVIPASSTAPPNRPATYGRVAWSKDGGAILFTHFDAPLISAYAFNSGAIGAKYGNPSSTPPGSSASGMAFNPAGSRIALGTNSTASGGANSVCAYLWSDSSGFGSRAGTNFTSGVEPRSLAWSPTGNWVGATSTRPKAVRWTGSAFGTYDEFLQNDDIYDVSWNPTGDYVAFAQYKIYGGNPANLLRRLVILEWDDTTGFGANVSRNLNDGTSLHKGVRWSPDNKSIVLAGATAPYVKAFAWDNDTGVVGPALPNTAATTGIVANYVNFNTAGDVVFVGLNNSKLIAAYEYDSTTGFGAKYDDPDLTGFPTSGPYASGIDYKDFG